MKIEIKVGNPGRGNWALAIKRGNGEYEILHHKKLEGFPLAVAVFHELLHCLLWEFMPFSSIDKEHLFIGAMEKSFKRHAKKFWIGDIK